MSGIWGSTKSALGRAGSATAVGTAKAADATARASKRGKLKTQVKLLHRDVAKVKERLGKEIVALSGDALVVPEMEQINRLFSNARVQVQEIEAKIQQKKTTVRSLMQPGSASPRVEAGYPAGYARASDSYRRSTNSMVENTVARNPWSDGNSGWQADSEESGSVPVGTPVPPPPPAAPTPSTGPPTLPPGWQSARNAEGKEYYFHDTSGEVSWNRPTGVPKF